MKIKLLSFTEELGLQEISKRRYQVKPCPNLGEEEPVECNINFNYKIVLPEREEKSEPEPASKAIVLLHGLNERSWDKYLPWAEYLAKGLNRAVILFPLSMHMNRSPRLWSDPRAMQKLIEQEKSLGEDAKNLSFVNYALSKRLSADPFRFYLSGRESLYNIRQLAQEIESGSHPLFKRGCSLDIFAYSIGALLSQVLLLSDSSGLFSRSKLFLFCGGALFSEMDGSSKLIMSNSAFRKLNSYFTTKFLTKSGESRVVGDQIEEAFIAHIERESFRERRELFYRLNSDRIKIVSLKRDKVIPTRGIELAVGAGALHCIEELEFPFGYSHENPFPTGRVEADIRENHFKRVFDRAVKFFTLPK
ncbi:MAG: DUF6051 family protein [Bacteroidales bacterium]